MEHHKELQEILKKDCHLWTKKDLLAGIQEITQLITESLTLLQSDYMHGDYEHNFKQTFKHLFNKYHQEHPYTKHDLQLKKDLVLHYRDMLHRDVVMFGAHSTDLLMHDILDRTLLQNNQALINKRNKDIGHLSAVIRSLQEYITERFS